MRFWKRQKRLSERQIDRYQEMHREIEAVLAHYQHLRP